MRDDELPVQKILVQADALFDTFAGTLYRMNPEYLPEAIKNGYHDKNHAYVSDYVKNIDRAEFERLYKARDVETLEASYGTEVVANISGEIAGVIALEHDHPIKKKFEITVNMWPYKDCTYSDGKTLYSTIRSALATHWGGLMPKFVFMSPREVTPFILAKNYNHYILYDFSEWGYIHHANFHLARMNALTLTFPLILIDRERHRPIESIHGAMRMQFGEFFVTDTYPLKAFRFIKGDNTHARDDARQNSDKDDN